MKMWAMAKKHRATFIVVVVALLVAGTMLTVAMAQPGPGQQGADDQNNQRGRDFRAMMQRGGDSVALAVSGDSVFLFARNTLYKIDANTMEIVGQTELPRPERPNRDQQNQ